MARRPDLFQLCPGKKTFSPVGLDSLDIHRGQWKTGGLRYHIGVGEGVWGGGDAGRGGGDESGTLCFNSILVQQGHGICCVRQAKKPKFG